MFKGLGFRLIHGMCRCRAVHLTSRQHTRTLNSLITKSNRSSAVTVQTLQRQSPLRSEQQRLFWGVDVAFNKVDEERVKLAGPDRAAAEWVLRNGGSIKWTTSSNKLADFNMLPSTDFDSYKLEEIDLTAIDVIGLGFEHLKDLKHLKKIILHGCRCIGDDALEHLHYVQDTLEHLEICRCPMITEKGLKLLTELKKLKYLMIYDLIEIKNLDPVVKSLKSAMPWCTIDSTDPLLSKTSKDEQ